MKADCLYSPELLMIFTVYILQRSSKRQIEEDKFNSVMKLLMKRQIIIFATCFLTWNLHIVHTQPASPT